jgi:hypothetical protein
MEYSLNEWAQVIWGVGILTILILSLIVSAFDG